MATWAHQNRIETLGELAALSPAFGGFTYVELELVADWSGASPANPVVRITGGPKNADLTELWTIRLKVGEVVGLLITPASAANRGFSGLDPARVFRQKSDGGYSNGQLFTKQALALDTIGHTVQRLVNLGTACSQQDVVTDLDGPPPGGEAPAAGVQTTTPSVGPSAPPGGRRRAMTRRRTTRIAGCFALLAPALLSAAACNGDAPGAAPAGSSQLPPSCKARADCADAGWPEWVCLFGYCGPEPPPCTTPCSGALRGFTCVHSGVQAYCDGCTSDSACLSPGDCRTLMGAPCKPDLDAGPPVEAASCPDGMRCPVVL
jgi:hypothetical protein